jgi:hypothetical protein
MSISSRAAARFFDLPARRSRRIQIQAALAVPMRDGVTLLADRWSAADIPGGPIVLMRSPYGRTGSFAVIARLFAERGFQLVLQSCRGTCGSGGVLDPMRQEQADGLDTLDWIRAQPWFSGRIYTFGASYLGFTQWAIAKQAGKRIDGMTLQVTLSNFRNETLAFGGFTLEGSLRWTTFMNTLAAPGPLWASILGRGGARKWEKIQAHLPLRGLDTLAIGKQISWWQDWVGHGDPQDPWWQLIDHSAGVADVEVPAAMIGGWRDIFLPWQVRDFEAMQQRGRDVWLTIGPWGHASLTGMGESLRQALSLFAAHSSGARPFAERDRVRLFVMGAGQWRDYASWPPPGSRQQRLHLHASASLSIATPSPRSDPTSYIYDPRDPTPSVHGPKLLGGARIPDMSRLERRADHAAFTTAALASDLEVIGPVTVEMYVRSDRTHTDFYACLCDVDLRGRALHVLDGYLRLRPEDPAPDAHGVRRILIECWPTAYRFRRGHRLRLLIASGAHPRYARNLGTGEPLGTGTRMLIARQQIFHDEARPSAIHLTMRDALQV